MKCKLCKGRTEDLRVVPGDVIPAHVICNEHDNMGRLRRDNDAGHQEAEEVGEHHGGQSGLLQHASINWPAAALLIVIACLIFKRGGSLPI